MNGEKSKWRMAEVLGALGVIASLVFVGLEIRQSNAYARQEALSSMIEEWNSLAE